MSRTLEHCPRCDYSLEGLPAAHACPECGLRYDEHSFVHEQRPDRVMSIAMGGVLLAGAVTFFKASSDPSRAPLASLLLLAIGGLLLLSIILVVRAHRRGNHLVAVTPDGVFIREANGAANLFSWDMIDLVHVGGLGGKVVSIQGYYLPPQEVMRSVIDKTSVDAFAGRLREAMERYKGSQNGDVQRLPSEADS